MTRFQFPMEKWKWVPTFLLISCKMRWKTGSGGKVIFRRTRGWSSPRPEADRERLMPIPDVFSSSTEANRNRIGWKPRPTRYLADPRRNRTTLARRQASYLCMIENDFNMFLLRED